MITFEELRERLKRSNLIENPLKRRLWILAILTEALKTIGERPVLIGGEAPLTEVEIEDMRCYIIGLEDLIIDRLNGFVHWHWEDDRRWVKRLLSLHGQEINKAYLFLKAGEQSTKKALIEIYHEMEKDNGP